jgi:hypothetical protein
MAAKSESYTLTKPTRNFVEFFYWLKKGMNYSPDICVDVGNGAGTPSIIQSFPNAHHVIFSSSPSHSAQAQKTLKGMSHEIFDLVLKDKETSGGGELSCSTLDHEIGAGISGKSILLKTEYQGDDLLVIRGGAKVLEQCDVVIMRTPFYRFRGGTSPDFYDIVHHMKQQGFVVFDILNGAFRPTNRALGQVDLAFVKGAGKLRPHHRW